MDGWTDGCGPWGAGTEGGDKAAPLQHGQSREQEVMNEPQLLEGEQELEENLDGDLGIPSKGAACGREAARQDLGLKDVGGGRDAQEIPARAGGQTPLCALTTGSSLPSIPGKLEGSGQMGKRQDKDPLRA